MDRRFGTDYLARATVSLKNIYPNALDHAIFVVADVQRTSNRLVQRVGFEVPLLIFPVCAQFAGGGGVVAMAVDDHFALDSVEGLFEGAFHDGVAGFGGL